MLTQDRTVMMHRVRENYFDSKQRRFREDRNFLLDVTILFENATFTLARYGSVLEKLVAPCPPGLALTPH